MNLPDGVFDRPRQSILIAKNEPAIIQIETGTRFSANIPYHVTVRSYGNDVAPYLKGDWEDFDRLFGLDPNRVPNPEVDAQTLGNVVAYSFAQHEVKPEESQKLPNITVVPNLETTNYEGLISRRTVFGCTMGHYHPPSNLGYLVQEVYEFQGYGLMVLDHGTGEIELWVARDGDKVSVPSDCHMTLYNLGDNYHPLIMLNVAHASHEPKKDLVKKCGPVLLVYFDDTEVVFVLNRLYINNPHYRAGVRLKNPSYENREIRITRGARMELGRLLCEQLTQNPDLIGRFARLGIRIRQASPEAILEPVSATKPSRLYFCHSLVNATRKGTDVYRYFFPEAERAVPAPGYRTEALPESESPSKSKPKKEAEGAAVTSSHRHLMIVVEGGGDWVEQTYRGLFKKKVDFYARQIDKGIAFSVFYADDSRWKDRPTWANPDLRSSSAEWNPATTSLQPWEVYLDKADPDGFSQYSNLRPDVVFIVTPDYTHCALARQWLGKTPMIFIEKPFDSQITNVETMLLSLGEKQYSDSPTEIMGLDHYQLYALPIVAQERRINEHLGGYISSVNFYLTESRPIELSRVRTLQYGLTLDLLPHFIALLTYFGDVGSIDEITVVEAGQYRPLIAASRDGSQHKPIGDTFLGETYSHVRFTFQDRSGNGFRIPCTAIVGKGFSKDVKYMEVNGKSGNAIRIDLNPRPEDWKNPYPLDALMFLQGDRSLNIVDANDLNVTDPYSQKQLRIRFDPANPERLCPRLERSRYERLLTDLLEEQNEAVPSTLTRSQGREIVYALDRIWWAIRETRPWRKYDLGKLNPLSP